MSRIPCLLAILAVLSSAVPALSYEPEINGGPSSTIGTGTRLFERGSGRLEVTP